ncbi:MAG: hypothetical protein ACOC44_12735 [Promethearchaeia archaeon]
MDPQELNTIKTSILKRSGFIGITRKILGTLDQKLAKFGEVKEESNPKKIVLFMINVILSLDFWTKDQLLEQAKLYFFY